MYIYIVMLLISLFFAFILMQVKKQEAPYLFFKSFKIKKVYLEYGLLFLSMLPFILISGLRRDIGYDYDQTYQPYFNSVAKDTWRPPAGLFSELGYYYVNKLVAVLGGGYVWLFLSIAVITIVPFWIGFYKQSKNICMSITMFFCGEMFFLSMDAIRQFIGLAIVFYAFKYVEKQSFLKYSVFVLIGCQFHKSIIIFLPLYFLQYIKMSPVIATVLFGVGSIANGFADKIMTFLVSNSIYGNYVGSIYNEFDRIFLARVSVYSMMFVIACVFYYKDNNKDNKLYRFMFNILTIMTFISWNANIIPAANRFCWSLEIILLLLIPFILESCKNKWVKYIIWIFIIAVFSQMCYSELVVIKNQGVIPYKFTFIPSMVFH